jgi:hypothetical protein
MVNTISLNEGLLLADRRSTLPGFHFRPLCELGTEWRDRVRVCAGGTADSDGCIHDDLAIFNTLASGEAEYDGRFYIGFLECLELRGWYIESYDAEIHLIVPILDAQSDMAQAERHKVAARSAQSMRDINCKPLVAVAVPDGDGWCPF